MTIKLILAKTNYDPTTTWTDIKTVEVDLPLVSQDGWNVIGADWEHDIIHRKRQQERIEANRLIIYNPDDFEYSKERTDYIKLECISCDKSVVLLDKFSDGHSCRFCNEYMSPVSYVRRK